jgi:hypothetical protein
MGMILIVCPIVFAPFIRTKALLELEEEGDLYDMFFGKKPAALSDSLKAAADSFAWKTNRLRYEALGSIIELSPEGSELSNMPAQKSKVSVCSVMSSVLFVIKQCHRYWIA